MSTSEGFICCVCRWGHAGLDLSETRLRRPVDGHPHFLPFWYVCLFHMKSRCFRAHECHFEREPPLSSDLVSDMAFSPFDDGLLVTCSADETVSSLPCISPWSHLFRFHAPLGLCCSWQGAARPLFFRLPPLGALSSDAGVGAGRNLLSCVFRLSSSVTRGTRLNPQNCHKHTRIRLQPSLILLIFPQSDVFLT